MEKKYILEGLDCPSCAMKIEAALNKREEVEEASVNAATLHCIIHYREYNEAIENQIIHLIEDLEDVHVVKKEKHHHEHEEQHHVHHECHCDHEHSHEHECECGHEHHHHEACAFTANEHREEPKDKSLKKTKWMLEGLDCANCARKVEEAVSKVEGINYASLNFTTKTLIFYSKYPSADLKQRVKKAILDTEDVVILEEKNQSTEKKEYKLLDLGIGTILFVLGVIMKLDMLVIVSYFIIGFDVMTKAVKNISKKEIFDENFLMLIATLGAIVVGEYSEAVAVMLFYQIGEYFQNRAVEHSRKSIADLMDIQVNVAHLINGNEQKDVEPESVRIGDKILVKPGERIPLDGVIVKGNSTLDTSALTGESLPREVSLHDEVLAGCINLQGVLEIEVNKEASESTISRILDMVENASGKKAKTELKMTRFAKVYTPIVVVAALMLAIVPNFFNTGIGWQEWLIRACTFLVISCPCALVLSIPLGYFAGIGSASRKGILVKGGNYLEILSEIDTVVFDKTGTLTNGSFKVTNIQSKDEKLTLKLAAYGESYSNHPIALSILNEYNEKIDKELIANVEEIAGYGIKTEYEGKELLVGNEKLLKKFNIETEPTDLDGTLVYVAYDSAFVGIIEINDTLKDNTKESLKQLKEKGIHKLIMLTGDRKETAEKIAKECGIDEVHAQLLPTHKVEEMEKILNQSSKKVAYVGDGINDAPVLARSDLGIAMGGLGSEAAVEASDLVLMKDDISSLSQGIDLAKFTQKIMNQNIVFILSVKGIILLLSMFGYANMWLGVFADVGVSILSVLNSMRILRK